MPSHACSTEGVSVSNREIAMRLFQARKNSEGAVNWLRDDLGVPARVAQAELVEAVLSRSIDRTGTATESYAAAPWEDVRQILARELASEEYAVLSTVPPCPIGDGLGFVEIPPEEVVATARAVLARRGEVELWGPSARVSVFVEEMESDGAQAGERFDVDLARW